MSPCLAVMAKQPVRGGVKTRIAATLGEDRAVELHRCALQDTLALAASIADVAHVLSYAPPTQEARRYFEHTAPTFALIPQAGGTFGERLNGTFERLLQRYSPVILIGSDSPDLPAALIKRAFDLLQAQADAVLGPADDGGYYLLGMRSMQSMLFERIDWSTDAVAQQTRQRAADAGLHLADLPSWHDLDTVDDLQALVELGAPLTRAFVAALNARGVNDENTSGGCVEGR